MERITDRISSRTAGSAGNLGSRTSQGRNRILRHLSWGSSQRLLQHNLPGADSRSATKSVNGLQPPNRVRLLGIEIDAVWDHSVRRPYGNYPWCTAIQSPPLATFARGRLRSNLVQ